MKRILFALTLAAALNAAQATIFYNETFSYPDGALTNVSAGAWITHSGATGPFVQVLNGQATLNQTTGKEDAHRVANSSMGAGDTWYAGLDVSVSGGSTYAYFAHFMVDGTSFFGTKLFVTNSTAGNGDFAFGLSGSANNPQKVWANDGTFNTTYRIVLSYNYDTKESTMWVNPTSQSSTSVSDIGSFQNAMNSFALRQGGGNSTEVIDNLVFANNFTEALTGVAVPEPSTIGLSLLGLTLVALRRARA